MVQRRVSYDDHFVNDDHLVEVTNVWRNFISDTFFMTFKMKWFSAELHTTDILWTTTLLWKLLTYDVTSFQIHFHEGVVLGSLGTSLDPHSWTTGYSATNYKRIMTIIIQFFIIYMPNQHVQGQLQEQRSVGTVNYSTCIQKREDKTRRPV
jgi:hypothetical protein